MSKFSVTVLGAGSWGTALSMVLCNKGHKVNLWMRSKEQYKDMVNTRKNNKYLPGVTLPDDLNLCIDLKKSIFNVNAILISGHLNLLEKFCKKLAPI